MEAHGEQESTVHVELRGLSIYTHHGVTEAEREIGQRLVIDVSFDVPDCDAVLTDRLLRAHVRWHFWKADGSHIADADFEYLLRRDGDGLLAHVATLLGEGAAG